jgi:hypothetical protein
MGKQVEEDELYNVYGAIGDVFPDMRKVKYEDFKKKYESDSDYARNIHGLVIADNLIEGAPEDFDTFYSATKKKSGGTSSGGV